MASQAQQKNIVIGLYKKNDVVFLTTALILGKAAKYEELRFARHGAFWLIKIPRGTLRFWAVFHGFIGGQYNKMGYMMGPDSKLYKWQREIPKR